MRKFKHVVIVAMLASIATVALADDAAPVYDADSFPPQFDGQEASQAPSSPPSSSGSTFVPVQNDAPAPGPSLSMDQRIARAEQKLNDLQQTNVESKLETLQGELQSLRGQVEDLTHQLQVAQSQQKTMYSDLDKRLADNKQAAPAAAPDLAAMTPADDTSVAPPPVPHKSTAASKKAKAVIAPAADTVASNDSDAAPPAPVLTKAEAKAAKAAVKSEAQQPNVAEEQQTYQTAYDLIKAKKYTEAIAALQKMLQKYPTGQFAANAHYWLGELYGLLGKNDQSATEFGSVVKNYPDSPKVSDAQLKLGLIYSAQFKWPDAKTAFKKVINRYPGTASSRLAAEQLKQIKEAGH